jgi:hypothetical protein
MMNEKMRRDLKYLMEKMIFFFFFLFAYLLVNKNESQTTIMVQTEYDQIAWKRERERKL